jgi:hypothetical protein
MKKGFLLILSLLLLGNPMKAQHFIEHGSMYPERWLFLFPKNIEGFKRMQTEYWNFDSSSNSSKWKLAEQWTHSGGSSVEPTQLLFEYRDSGQWHASDSLFYTFENGRIKQMTTGLIPDGFLQKYTYGINGRLEKVLSQQTDSLVWVNQELDSNIYNAAGRMILTYKQKWGNQWENDYQDTFSYNNTGKLSFKETRMWFFNEYVPYRRYHYSYDAANNMIGIRFEDISNHHMVDTTHRTTMTYDAQGRMTQLLTQSYSSGIWNNSSRVGFLLNNAGKVLQELYEIVENGTWKNAERTNYLYTTGTTEVLLDKAVFEVLPNPVQNGLLYVQAKDKTTLMRNIELYDINGRLVMQQNIDNQWFANVETARLMNGLHVLKIKTDKGVNIQKVMIQQ